VQTESTHPELLVRSDGDFGPRLEKTENNMNASHLLRASVIVLLSATVVACGGGSDDTPPPVPTPAPAPSPTPSPPPPPPAVPTVARIEIAPSRLSLAPGQTRRLSARTLDAAGAPIAAPVDWRSSDPTRVSIAGDVATAVAAGEVTLTAASGAISSSPMPVRVSAPAQSDRLIDAARAAGTIDATTALKYRVFAAYDDPRLPFEYVGNQRPRYANEIGFQLAAAYETMSAADQAEMGPFMLPPIYSDSWRGLRRAARTTASGIDPAPTARLHKHVAAAPGGRSDARVRAAAARPAPCSGLIDAGWVAVDSAHFRVWYDTSAAAGTAVTATQAASVSAAAEESYLALSALGMRLPLADNALAHPCHGGDGRLDIYLVEPGTAGTDDDDAPGIPSSLGITVTINDTGTPSPVFISLSANTLGNGQMFGTLAHEYMHAVQAAYRNHGSAGAGAGVFLKDATADWAIDYVRATDNLEQASAPGLLSDMLPPLWSTASSGRRYGAYLFFQFVARVRDSAGNDYGGAAAVRSFWEQLDAQPPVRCNRWRR
jgi:hypothetical protein